VRWCTFQQQEAPPWCRFSWEIQDVYLHFRFSFHHPSDLCFIFCVFCFFLTVLQLRNAIEEYENGYVGSIEFTEDRYRPYYDKCISEMERIEKDEHHGPKCQAEWQSWADRLPLQKKKLQRRVELVDDNELCAILD